MFLFSWFCSAGHQLVVHTLYLLVTACPTSGKKNIWIMEESDITAVVCAVLDWNSLWLNLIKQQLSAARSMNTLWKYKRMCSVSRSAAFDLSHFMWHSWFLWLKALERRVGRPLLSHTVLKVKDELPWPTLGCTFFLSHFTCKQTHSADSPQGGAVWSLSEQLYTPTSTLCRKIH